MIQYQFDYLILDRTDIKRQDQIIKNVKQSHIRVQEC